MGLWYFVKLTWYLLFNRQIDRKTCRIYASFQLSASQSIIHVKFLRYWSDCSHAGTKSWNWSYCEHFSVNARPLTVKIPNISYKWKVAYDFTLYSPPSWNALHCCQKVYTVSRSRLLRCVIVRKLVTELLIFIDFRFWFRWGFMSQSTTFTHFSFENQLGSHSFENQLGSQPTHTRTFSQACRVVGFCVFFCVCT